jgi:RimJ/RimL family protein N-acetyltransferase
MSESTVETRPARHTDAAALVALTRDIIAEARWMLRDPDERIGWWDRAEEYLARLETGKEATIVFVAAAADGLVGWLSATSPVLRRIAGNVDLVLGVRESHAGRGIGGRLLAAAEDWARERQAVRLELTVVADNERARRLYEKAGFVVEGVMRSHIRIDGVLHDEIMMAKLL